MEFTEENLLYQKSFLGWISFHHPEIKTFVEKLDVIAYDIGIYHYQLTEHNYDDTIALVNEEQLNLKDIEYTKRVGWCEFKHIKYDVLDLIYIWDKHLSVLLKYFCEQFILRHPGTKCMFGDL